MKVVVAALSPTPILWLRASALASPTEVPASTLPARGTAPVRANIASRRVVLPLWKGPTSAMHRGPRGLLTSCPIAASFIWSSALDWVGRLDAPPTSTIWQAGKTSLEGIVSRTRCSVLHDAPQSRDPFALEMDPGPAARTLRAALNPGNAASPSRPKFQAFQPGRDIEADH